MLQITKLTGASFADLKQAADYPDERGTEKERGRDPFPEPVGSLETVADYYATENEIDFTPSEWLGDREALRELGLTPGTPALRDDRLGVMQGYNPGTGEELVQNTGVARTYGWDATFNAPKSVSSTWARADAAQRAGIERAHMRAVRDAINQAGKHLYARRGKDGLEIERGVGYLGAAFMHRESRPVTDENGMQWIAPHLHSHVQIMNLARRADGTWGALGTHELYQAKMELGALYQSSLASRLREIGYAVERDQRTDVFRITDVPRELEKADSPRRSQIEETMRAKGWEGGKAAKYASLMTREHKDLPSLSYLRIQWQETAEKVAPEFSPRKLTHDPADLKAAEIDRESLVADVTEDRSVVTETQMRAIAYRQASWSGVSPEDAENVLAAAIEDGEIIRLADDAWTTREMLQIESAMVSNARELRAQQLVPVRADLREQTVAEWEKLHAMDLTSGQRQAVDHLTKHSGIELVQGLPGTGKSTAMAAAYEAWKEQGYTVHGLAPTGRAAEQLSESIPGSKTVASAELLAEDGRGPLADKGSIIVIDEAGMVDSRTMAGIIEKARENDIAIRLVGDERQLQPVQAGGAFKALRSELGSGRLTTIIRQESVAERQMVAGLSEGKVREGLDYLNARERVHIADDRLRAAVTAVEKWSEHYDLNNPKSSMMVTGSNEAARGLNASARAYLQEEGKLSRSEEIKLQALDRDGVERELPVSPGERITFRENSRELGVTNGMSGTVERISSQDNAGQRWLTVRTDDGRQVRFTPDEPSGNGAKPYKMIEHGYARTVHVSQGSTVEHSVYVSLGPKSAELTNVALSRHKQTADVVFSRDAIDKSQEGLEPTGKMVDLAETVAEEKGMELPEEAREDFQACRDFLDENARAALGNTRQWGEWQDDVKETVAALAAEHQKDTTLEYAAPEFEVVEPDLEKRAASLGQADREFERAQQEMAERAVSSEIDDAEARVEAEASRPSRTEERAQEPREEPAQEVEPDGPSLGI